MQQTGELEEISVRDLKGLRIGNAQDDQAKTGVTVLLFDKGAKVGVDVSGGGPASRRIWQIQLQQIIRSMRSCWLAVRHTDLQQRMA